MYRISVYCRNSIVRPSNYYRIYQYVNRNDEVRVNNLVPGKLYSKSLVENSKILKLILQIISYGLNFVNALICLTRDYFIQPEYIVIQREIIPRYIPLILIGLLKINLQHSKLIWDFDDYIQKAKEISNRENKFLQKNSSTIIVTSEYLRDKIQDKYRKKVRLMPTTEKTYNLKNDDEIYINKINDYKNRIDLVWVGTPVNLINIDKIIDALDETAKEMKKKLVLNVISSKPYNHECKNIVIRNIEWTREEAVIQMKKAHIGVMPLIEGEFQLGKGGFKLIQYMANGLPILSSDYGFNKEVVTKECGFLCNTKEEWKQGILYLSSDIEIWKRYSENSKKRYDENFSYEENKKVWDNLLETKEK